jgi:hypothetical protein
LNLLHHLIGGHLIEVALSLNTLHIRGLIWGESKNVLHLDPLITLQGFGSIATTTFVVISEKLSQYLPIATTLRSLPSVATGRMVIGYYHKNQNVARKRSIATAMSQVATFFLVAART